MGIRLVAKLSATSMLISFFGRATQELSHESRPVFREEYDDVDFTRFEASRLEGLLCARRIVSSVTRSPS
jgi:hypothetical protein